MQSLRFSSNLAMPSSATVPVTGLLLSCTSCSCPLVCVVGTNHGSPHAVPLDIVNLQFNVHCHISQAFVDLQLICQYPQVQLAPLPFLHWFATATHHRQWPFCLRCSCLVVFFHPLCLPGLVAALKVMKICRQFIHSTEHTPVIPSQSSTPPLLCSHHRTGTMRLWSSSCPRRQTRQSRSCALRTC